MTNANKDQMERAQWVFEKTLGWIAAAEVKVAAIVAIDAAILAGLGAVFAAEGQKSAWANVFGVAALLLFFICIVCAAMVLIPRLDGGPSQSLLYFGKIVKLTEDAYEKQFRNTPDDRMLSDWTAQIHFNARIAQRKHEWTLKCLYWSLAYAPVGLGAMLVALASR